MTKLSSISDTNGPTAEYDQLIAARAPFLRSLEPPGRTLPRPRIEIELLRERFKTSLQRTPAGRTVPNGG